MSESCHTHIYASTPTYTNMYNFGHTLCLNLNNNLVLTTGFMFRVQKSQEFSFLFFRYLGSQGNPWTIFTAVETRIHRSQISQGNFTEHWSYNLKRLGQTFPLCSPTSLPRDTVVEAHGRAGCLKPNFLTWGQKGFSGNKKVIGDQGRGRSLGEQPYKVD